MNICLHFFIIIFIIKIPLYLSVPQTPQNRYKQEFLGNFIISLCVFYNYFFTALKLFFKHASIHVKISDLHNFFRCRKTLEYFPNIDFMQIFHKK